MLFDEIEDTRRDINKVYALNEIVFLTMAAVLSGAKGWRDIAIFGEAKLDWLRQFLPFEEGIPTRHSIGRIIRTVSTDSLAGSFATWINDHRAKNQKEHIAFDGKTLKGSGRNNHVKALHLMGAMVVDSGLVLFQSECKEKENEITVLRSMLDNIAVKGAVISADAMHCQKETAEKIIDKGADYVLQVKNNQKKLKQEIQAYFHKVDRDTPQLFENNTLNELDGEHGRIVERSYRVLPISDWIAGSEDWSGLKSIIEVSRTTHKGEEPHTELSYHISSLDASVSCLSQVIRNHWQIESHHWILDVVFSEDESLIYSEDGAKNIAMLKRVLTSLVKAHPLEGSVVGKIKRAGWDDKFRAEILFG